MDIRKIAESLIAELNAGEAQKKYQAEGVALFYNKMVQVSESERSTAESSTTQPAAAEAPASEEAPSTQAK